MVVSTRYETTRAKKLSKRETQIHAEIISPASDFRWRMLSDQREICEMAAANSLKSDKKSMSVKCKSTRSLLEAEQSILAAIDDVISKSISWSDDEQSRYRKRFTEVLTLASLWLCIASPVAIAPPPPVTSVSDAPPRHQRQ